MIKIKLLKPIFSIVILFLTLGIYKVNAQGCVAIRGFSPSNSFMDGEGVLVKGDFSVGTNFRYFQSFRHFRGTHEETNRVANGTEVINDSYFVDISFNYGLTTY